MKRWSSILWLFFLLVGAAAAQQGTLQIKETEFPWVSEVIPRVGRLQEEALRTEGLLDQIRKNASVRKELIALERSQQELEQRISQFGDPAQWSLDRLQSVRGELADQQQDLKRILDSLSERLAEMERLRKDWNQRQEFWDQWEEHLRSGESVLPADGFEKARRIIGLELKKIEEAHQPLVELQKTVTSLQARNLEFLTRIEAALDAFRGQTFKKTSPSFVSRDFFWQFNSELWKEVSEGFENIGLVDDDFFHEQGWVFALQALIVLILPLLIIRNRRLSEVTKEWRFIMEHPWATGMFVALSLLSPLYATPPPLWRLFLTLLAAGSAAILFAGLLNNPRKIFMVYLLAVLSVLSLGLQIISLPTPLYRLYLALLSLSGIPLLLVLAARNRRAHGGKVRGFTLSLQLGAVILVISLLVQFAGFDRLASRLIEASVSSVFLVLFTTMAIRLGRGGIDYLLSHPLVRANKFFQRFGDELIRRLHDILEVLLGALAFLYLLVVWGIFNSMGQAWETLLNWSITAGEMQVSLKMILWIGLVLYITLLVSWFIRAVLETQIFPRREFDRGVRDAIKKLLHYALITLGFLLAMSLAGVELKNFAVLAGALGIGLGFGLQNIVNNFISGIILLFERPIKVGDMVVLAGEWGTVRKIGLRSTVVETLDQSEIIVPNSELISEKVTNWTLSTKVARVVVTVGVAYGSNVPLVLKILTEAAVNHPDVLSEPAPSPIFTGFGDSSLDFELRVWVNDIQKRFRIKSDLNQAIDRGFRDAGIEIPFPQRDLHLRSVDQGIVIGREGMKGEDGGSAPPPPPKTVG